MTSARPAAAYMCAAFIAMTACGTSEPAAPVPAPTAPCAGSIAGDTYDATSCPWFRTPPKPSSDSGGSMGLPVQASGAPKLELLSGNCRIWGSTMSCDGLLDRP